MAEMFAMEVLFKVVATGELQSISYRQIFVTEAKDALGECFSTGLYCKGVTYEPVSMVQLCIYG
jgi:hypothetical protein